MAELPVTSRGVVYPWHMDHMGHMNVQHYVAMFHHGTWIFFAQVLGMDTAFFREHQTGMVAVEQTLKYRRELVAGDIVDIRSGLLEIKDKSIRFFHRMTHGGTGALVATSVYTGVYLDTQARKSVPLPAEVKARGLDWIVPEERVDAEA